MIEILMQVYEDFICKVRCVTVDIDDAEVKEHIEKRVQECGICNYSGQWGTEETTVEKMAELLKVDATMLNLDMEPYMYDAEIQALGFTPEDINAIRKHFLCRISMADWETMRLMDDVDEEDIESQENSLELPSGRVVVFGDDLLYHELLTQMD